jgi:hypothetical protein
MKWYRLWVKGPHIEEEEYLEMPDPVAESEVLLRREFNGWLALRALGSDLKGSKKGYEPVRRPPVGWLVDKAVSLKGEAKLLAEKAARYKALAEDKGGRREKSQVEWLAGTLFSEENREVPDRRKGKKA